MISLQLADGEAALLDPTGTIRDDTHSVQGGAFVELPPPPPLTEADLKAVFEGIAQRWIDTYARSWGYDDMRSAVSYVGDPYPPFAAEALALRNWRSQVWVFLGGQTLPSPVPAEAEFLALLPAPPARPV